MRVRAFFGVGVAACLAVALFKRPTPPVVSEKVVVPAPAAEAPPVLRQAEPEAAETVFPDLVLAPPLELQSGTLSWEERIKAITGSKTLTEPAKARELLRSLARLPEEGLEAATQEAADRLPDKEYAAALGLIINPQTHGRVLQVLFADLLARPDEVTLPALLMIARNETHPFSRQARDNLGLLVGKEFGTDWYRWDAEIRRLLKAGGI